jgi:hypothetical protein
MIKIITTIAFFYLVVCSRTIRAGMGKAFQLWDEGKTLKLRMYSVAAAEKQVGCLITT